MALVAMQTLPISYAALGLILLGIALLVAESFVPSFGLLGFGGLASLMFGSLFLLDDSQTDLRVSEPVVFITVGTISVIILVIGRLLLRSFNRPLQSFQSNMEGHTAVVKSPIEPLGRGMVLINGELWKARAEAAIPQGEKVVVEQVNGLELRVKAVPTDPESKDPKAESRR